MTAILEESFVETKSLPIMPRKVRTGLCNFVVLMKNDSDQTLTATFLGAVLFKRLAVPIDASLAHTLIDTLMDDEKRAKFCVKRGISEQMANEAVKDGAAKAFEEEISIYSPDYTPKKNHKKAEADDDEDDKKTEKSKKRTKKEEKFQSPDKKKAKKAVASKPKKEAAVSVESEKKEDEKAEDDAPKQEEKKD